MIDLTREERGFIAAPLVASTINSLVPAYHLVNGPGGDRSLLANLWFVVVMAGIGLPVAIAVTLLLALPAYLLIRFTVGVSLSTTAAGGVAIGLVVSLLFTYVTGDWSAVPLTRASVIGALTAAVWWLITGKARASREAAA